MFYCDPCREKKKWPEGFHQSYGPCEICGVSAGCWDVPSSCLPIPRKGVNDGIQRTDQVPQLRSEVRPRQESVQSLRNAAPEEGNPTGLGSGGQQQAGTAQAEVSQAYQAWEELREILFQSDRMTNQVVNAWGVFSIPGGTVYEEILRIMEKLEEKYDVDS